MYSGRQPIRQTLRDPQVCPCGFRQGFLLKQSEKTDWENESKQNLGKEEKTNLAGSLR